MFKRPFAYAVIASSANDQKASAERLSGTPIDPFLPLGEPSAGSEDVESPTHLTTRENTHLLWVEPDPALLVFADVKAAVERDYFRPDFLSQSSKPLLTASKKCDNGSQAILVLDPAK